ncbi:hypothetical protein CEXT_189881 [Caerostris extrusa]|uniref:Uncharacterized protein n=1 Tax=Caerostris extrusa TaxID=172846 RepID=A0AAV4QPL0_CAEEX|nr:hypothetical protein CEXT_189881 [Caerostris extrusa]
MFDIWKDILGTFSYSLGLQGTGILKACFHLMNVGGLRRNCHCLIRASRNAKRTQPLPSIKDAPWPNIETDIIQDKFPDPPLFAIKHRVSINTGFSRMSSGTGKSSVMPFQIECFPEWETPLELLSHLLT